MGDATVTDDPTTLAARGLHANPVAGDRLQKTPARPPVLQKYGRAGVKARVDVLAEHLKKLLPQEMRHTTVAVLQGVLPSGQTVRIIATMNVEVHEALRRHARELLEVGEYLAPEPLLFDITVEGKRKQEVKFKIPTTPVHAEQLAVAHAKELGIRNIMVGTNFDGCEMCRKFLEKFHRDVDHVNLKSARLEQAKQLRLAKKRVKAAEKKVSRINRDIAKINNKMDTAREQLAAASKQRQRAKLQNMLEELQRKAADLQKELPQASHEFAQAAQEVQRLHEPDPEYLAVQQSSREAAAARATREAAVRAAVERHAAAKEKVTSLQSELQRKQDAIATAEKKAAGSKGAKVRARATERLQTLRSESLRLADELTLAVQRLEEARTALERIQTADAASTSAAATPPARATDTAAQVFDPRARGTPTPAHGFSALSQRQPAIAARLSALPPAASPASSAVPTLPSAVRTASRAARVWRLTKILGGVAIGFFVPLTRLDLAFELALELFMWDRARRKREEREWAEITAYLSSPGETVKDDLGMTYTTAAGHLLWEAANARLADPNDGQNMLHWLDRWEQNARWAGFVYVRYRGTLLRQKHAPRASSVRLAPHPVRFWPRERITAEFTTLGVFSNKEMKVLSRQDLSYKDPNNLFTVGDQADPYVTRRAPESMRSEYLHRDVESVELRINVTLPTPVITPFDIVLFKANTLIVDILLFASRYSEDFFPTDYPFQRVGNMFVVNYIADVQFPKPLDNAKAHHALRELYRLVLAFRGHVASRGNPAELATWRFQLAYPWAPVDQKGNWQLHRRPLRDVATSLYTLTSDENPKRYNPQSDPELSYITTKYLGDSAERIEADIRRMVLDMRSERPERRELYRYVGAGADEE